MKAKKMAKLKPKLSYEKNIPLFNLEEEKIRRLNLDENVFSGNYPNAERKINLSIKGNSERKVSGKFLNNINRKEKADYPSKKMSSSNTINDVMNLKEETFPLNNLKLSLKKLKAIIPNIYEKIGSNYSAKIISSSKIYNINYEKNLNNILKRLNKKEEELKQKKEKLEDEMDKIESEIYDNQLNIEVIRNPNFQKNVKDKIIKNYENKLKEIKEQEILNNNKESQKQEVIKKKLFSVENKYKDENEIKEEQKKKENKKFSVKSLFKGKLLKAKTNNIMLGFYLLSRTKSEQFKNDINNKKDSKKAIFEEIKQLHEKLRSIHFSKKRVINNLYQHYLSILKEGIDTRDEGLSWVIAEILNLGKKVTMSYIPKYLDEKCILYLFLKAQLILKIKYIENKIQECKINFFKKGLIKKRNKKDIQNLKANYTLNIIKNKFIKKDTENTNEKLTNIEEDISLIDKDRIKNYRSSILFNKGLKNEYSSSSSFLKLNTFDYFNSSNNFEISSDIKFEDYNNLSLKNEQIISLEEFYSFYKEIEKLKKLKEILKDKEMNRIFEEIHGNQYCLKYQVDKDIVLSAIIGEENLYNESFNQFKKERELSEERLRTKIYRKNDLIKKYIINNNSRSINDINRYFKEKTYIKSMHNSIINSF